MDFVQFFFFFFLFPGEKVSSESAVRFEMEGNLSQLEIDENVSIMGKVLRYSILSEVRNKSCLRALLILRK